jgi:hypothetical protein
MICTTHQIFFRKIKKNEMGRACMADRRGTYSTLMGRTEGNRPLGRPSRDEKIILQWISKKWEGMA